MNRWQWVALIAFVASTGTFIGLAVHLSEHAQLKAEADAQRAVAELYAIERECQLQYPGNPGMQADCLEKME